jgi:glycosyltransferase involved in cell wall biosynthesis
LKKIIIVTTGQPSTNPRVVKEYSALKQAGYEVKVIYCHWAEWAIKADEKLFDTGELERKDFILAAGSPGKKAFRFFTSRVIFKLMRNLSTVLPFGFFKENSIARPAFALRRIAPGHKADLYIAHYPGALPAAVKAGKKFKAPVIFDAEDFHRGEAEGNSRHTQLVTGIETKYFPQIESMTTASPLISDAYHKIFHDGRITTINNVFSEKYLQKINTRTDKNLKLFWFSQTIGPDRGLENVMMALSQLAEYDISITLLGDCNDAYKEKLSSILMKKNTIHFIPAVSPAEIFSIAAEHDIGLATEIPWNENRDIALTNKIFTYMMSGLCIIASDTRAQENFLTEYPGAGLMYKHNLPPHLAAQIEILYNDRELLLHLRQNSLHIAETEMNWEKESVKFLMNVKHSLDRN